MPSLYCCIQSIPICSNTLYLFIHPFKKTEAILILPDYFLYFLLYCSPIQCRICKTNGTFTDNFSYQKKETIIHEYVIYRLKNIFFSIWIVLIDDLGSILKKEANYQFTIDKQLTFLHVGAWIRKKKIDFWSSTWSSLAKVLNLSLPFSQRA